ncbi:MAG: signal peptidase I [Bacilli bacterium]|nr:signal peptidase I [Bacilli bacterium]
MINSPKDDENNIKGSLEYVLKLLSTAIIVVLLLVGAFLIYYVFSNKISAAKKGIPPKISLYTIVSGSMEPAIKVSDIILNVRVTDFTSLKVGDVITYKSDNALIADTDMTITHRILDIKINEENNKREFITKGDANTSADLLPIQEQDIIGKTVLKIPQLGKIQLFLATKIGWLFIVLIPALGIIIYDILKLFKVLGVTGRAENIKGDISILKENEENKKILETLERIKKHPIQTKDTFNQKEADFTDDKISEQKELLINNFDQKILEKITTNFSDKQVDVKEDLTGSSLVKEKSNDKEEILNRIAALNKKIEEKKQEKEISSMKKNNIQKEDIKPIEVNSINKSNINRKQETKKEAHPNNKISSKNKSIPKNQNQRKDKPSKNQNNKFDQTNQSKKNQNNKFDQTNQSKKNQNNKHNINNKNKTKSNNQQNQKNKKAQQKKLSTLKNSPGNNNIKFKGNNLNKKVNKNNNKSFDKFSK